MLIQGILMKISSSQKYKEVQVGGETCWGEEETQWEWERDKKGQWGE